MSKLISKIKSVYGGITMVALLVAMATFAGATVYTMGGFSEGHEETTVGVGKELNAIIPDPNVYVPVTHAAIPVITGHNLSDTVLLEGESITFNMSATIRDNGELSYRWMQKREGSFQSVEVGQGPTFTYTPSAGVYYFYGEAINVNENVNGEQKATSKTPEVSIIVLAKAQTPTVQAMPEFVTQFNNESKTYTAKGTVTDSGVLSYKWYQSTDVTGKNPVLVSGNDKLTVSGKNIGLYYYFAEISNTVTYKAFGREHTTTIKTPVMTLESVQHSVAPDITSLGHKVVKSKTPHTFSISATSKDGGTLSYRWYVNTINSKNGATLLQNGPENTLEVSHDADRNAEVIKRYYFVEAVNTLDYYDSRGGKHTSSAYATSNIARMEVYPAALAPSIEKITDKIIIDDKTNVSVIAESSDGGTLSYKWYKVSTKTNSGGTLVGTSKTLSLTGLEVGPTYYYVTVTNSKPYAAVDGTIYDNDAIGTSNAFRVERINEAQMPTVSNLSNKVLRSGTPTVFNVTATREGEGILTYKWYEHTSNSYAGVVRSSTGATYEFTPSTSKDSEIIYVYVEVTNTLNFRDSTGYVHTSSRMARSNIARVEIYAPAEIPSLETIPDQNIKTSTATLKVIASISDGGTLSYQWYKASGKTNTLGTPVGTNSSSLSLTGLAIGPHYYYVDVINSKPYTAVDGTVYENNMSAKSSVVRVERIQLAQVPKVGTLANHTIQSGDSVSFDANASVTDGGVLSYTWYESPTLSSRGNIISTNRAITVKPEAVGEWNVQYYMVEVKNTYTYIDATGYKHVSTEVKNSNTARVEIYPKADKPVLNRLDNKVLRSGTPFSYKLNATVGDGGTLTYKWYINTANSYGGTLDTTSADYSNTITASTSDTVRYIWAEVVNTRTFKDLSGGTYTSTSTARSNIARVEVFAPAQKPSIQVIPDQEISKITGSISVSASVTDGGTLSYQWFSNSTGTNTGGTAISGATSSTISLSALKVGANFFYVKVTNSKPYRGMDGDSYENKTSAASNAVRIEVIKIARKPQVGTVTNKVLESGGNVLFDITASSVDEGTLTYEWYENTANTYGGTKIGSVKSFTKNYTTGSSATKKFYYVNVINTLNFKDSTGKIHTTTAEEKSNIGIIEVYPKAAQPVMTALEDVVVQGATASVTINATVSDGGTLSYQWYKTTTKTSSGGTAVGTNSKTLNLSGITVGPHYYYVRVTNTRGYKAVDGKTYNATAQAISNPVRVERVKVAEKPSIATLSNHVFPSGTGTTFKSEASVSDGGTLTYRWFESSTNTYGGTQVGTASTYSVTKTVSSGAMTRYYWVEVKNTLDYEDSTGKSHTTTATHRSNIARVETFAIARTPVIGTISDKVVTGTTATIDASVSTGDGGILTYRWYKTTTKTNSGGTPVGGNSSSLSLTGLAIGPTYYYLEVENSKPYTSVSGTVYPNKRSNKSNAFRVERVPSAAKPVLGSLSNKVLESGQTLTFNIGASVSDEGVLSYRWYENSSSAYGGSVVSTAPNYSKAQTTGDAATVKYVWVRVTNTLNFRDAAGDIQTTTAYTDSNIARVEIYPKAKQVSIGIIPDAVINGSGHTYKASITSYDSGVLSYKWFKVTSKVNTGGTLVSGSAGDTLSVAGIPIGQAQYYYLEVLNTRSYTSVSGQTYESKAVSKSNGFRVERIEEAVKPVIQNLTGGVFETGTPLTLTANVSDVGAGVLTYKWYENTTNAYAGSVVGTSKSYAKTLTATSAPVVRYYYVSVLNTFKYTDAEGVVHTTTKSTNSNIVRVETYLKAAAPTVATIPDKVLLSGTGAGYVSGAVSPDGGVLSYKWYETTTKSYSGNQRSTGANYNPVNTATSPITKYYWVEVTNSLPYKAVDGRTYYSRTSVKSNIAKLEVYPKATIPVIQPIADQFHDGNSINTSLSAVVSGTNGTVSYEWYKTTSAATTGGTRVGTSSTLTLNALTGGIYHYYVKVTNVYRYTSDSGTVYTDTNSATSNPVTIDVVKQAQKPSVGTLGNKVVLSGTTVSFSAGASSPDGGVLSYKWYENTANATGGTQKGTSSDYSVKKTVSSGALVRYYSVVVTNTVTVTDSKGEVHTTSNSATSNVARVETYAPAQSPSISTINAQNVTGSTAVVKVTASITDGGVLSYQWYKTTTPTTSGGSPVGTNSSTLNLSGLTIGPHYYYVTVKNTKTYTSLSGSKHPHVTSANSNSVRIERVQTAQTPTVGTLSNQILKSGVGYTFNASATAPDGGTLSYQWFENTSSAYAGTQVGTSATYIAKKTVSSPTVRYYYAVVTNNYTYTDAAGIKHPTSASAKTNIARVEYYPVATTPVISSLDSKVLKSGTAFSWNPTITGINGSVTYKWYENTTSATGGTQVGTTKSYSKTLSGTSPIKRYYSLLVTNTYTYISINGTAFTTTATKWSNIAKVEMYPASTKPSVGTLENKVVKTGTAASWSASVSGHNGSIAYEWYENTSNAVGGTKVSTASSMSRNHSVSSPITRYISLKVTNTYSYTSDSGAVHTDVQYTWSNVARLEVYPAVTTPSIGTITDKQYKTNSATVSIPATVSNINGTASYSWYQTTSKTTTGGTKVGSAQTLTRSGVTPGIYYYYLIVTNTYTYNSVSGQAYTQTATAKSNSVTVDVIRQAQAPAAFTLENKVHKSGQTTTYTTSGSPDGGTLSYNWYENTSNAFGGTQVGTGSSYLVNRTISSGAMIRYYSVKVTNTVKHTDSKGVVHTTTAVRNSNVARVETFAVAQTPTVGTIASQSVQSTSATLEVVASVTDGGTLSYEWFKTTTATPSGGTKVGTNSATLSISGMTVGPHYYYVRVTNSKPYTSVSGSVYSNTASRVSNSVRVERVQTAATPSVGTLSNAVLQTGVAKAYAAGASTTDGGTLSYSWRVSSTNAYSGSQVGTSSSYSYSRSVSTPLTQYLYVEVTNTYKYTDGAGTVHTTTAMKRSNIAKIEVYPIATTPTVGALSSKVVKSGTANEWTASVSGHNGSISYEWYENTSNAVGGTHVGSSSSLSRTYNTSSPLKRYISLKVTNTYTYTSSTGTKHTTSAYKWSNVAVVEVYPSATTPTVGTIGHRVVTSGVTATFGASVTGHNGNISYQWYENTTNATGGTAKGTGSSHSAVHTTTSSLTRYYSVRVTNTYSYTAGNGTVYTDAKTAWSNVARMEVYALAQTPTVGSVGSKSILPPGNTSLSVSASVSDGGTLSYKWFQTTSATTSGGTLVGTNSSTLSLTGLSVGKSYFYVEVTNSKPFTSASGTVYPNTASRKSNVATVTVLLNAQTPEVGSLAHKVVVSGTGVTYSAGASVTDGGTLSYKWYENTSNAYSGTVQSTASSYTVKHTVTTPLTRYYWVEVTNTRSYTDADGEVFTDTASAKSNIARVETYPAATTPSVSISGGNKVVKSGTAASWSSSVSGHNGNISYNWYENTSNENGGTSVGTSSTLSRNHSVSSPITRYISLKATNTYKYTSVSGTVYTSTASAWASRVRLEVYPAATAPSVSITGGHKVQRSGTTATWGSSVSGHNGSLAYQWYRNTSNANGGTGVGTNTTMSRSDTASSPVVYYISLRVINTYTYKSVAGTNYTDSQTVWASRVRYEVYPSATTPSVSITGSQAGPLGTSKRYTGSVSGHNGSVSYQWYENTSNATGGTKKGTNYYQDIKYTSRVTRYISLYVTNTYSYTSVSGTVYTHSAGKWSNVSAYDTYNTANTPTVTGITDHTTYDGSFSDTANGSGNGTISYKWYYGSTHKSNNQSYSQSGLGLGTHSFKVVVTNSLTDKGHSSSASTTKTFTVTSKWLVTATDDNVGLIMRSGPGSSYGIIDSYKAGTRITKLHSGSALDTYWHVTLSNGKTGYMYQGTTGRGNRYMEEVTSSTATYTTTTNLNLRHSPSSSGGQILAMPTGAKVYHLRTTSSYWYRVLYISGSSWYVGWTSSNYLK